MPASRQHPQSPLGLAPREKASPNFSQNQRSEYNSPQSPPLLFLHLHLQHHPNPQSISPSTGVWKSGVASSPLSSSRPFCRFLSSLKQSSVRPCHNSSIHHLRIFSSIPFPQSVQIVSQSSPHISRARSAPVFARSSSKINDRQTSGNCRVLFSYTSTYKGIITCRTSNSTSNLFAVVRRFSG